VRVDRGAHLDFLDLDGLLLLARLGGLLLRLELVFSVVEDLDDRRLGIRGDLYEIETRLIGALPRILDVDNSVVLAFCINKLNLRDTDLVIDPGALLDGGGSAIGTANGRFSFLLLRT